jgi:hypothetical protein
MTTENDELRAALKVKFRAKAAAQPMGEHAKQNKKQLQKFKYCLVGKPNASASGSGSGRGSASASAPQLSSHTQEPRMSSFQMQLFNTYLSITDRFEIIEPAAEVGLFPESVPQGQ